MKKLWALFFYCTCAMLHGTDYHVSLINLENGGFKFFVMHGSEPGHVKGVFGKNEQKTQLLPEPEMTVTFPGYLHHFFKSYGIVTFAIGDFFVKIESDRSVFLWGADPKKDRVYIYTSTNFGKPFRLDCKGVKAPVFSGQTDKTTSGSIRRNMTFRRRRLPERIIVSRTSTAKRRSNSTIKSLY